MAEVIINRKWAEAIMRICSEHDDCPECPYEKTCNAVCFVEGDDAPCNWNLDIMQDEAEGGVFAEYDE